jgi:hypothetical protein
MSKHCYALVSAAGEIMRTTGPLEQAPGPVIGAGNVQMGVWQQVYDTGPGIPAHHNPDDYEQHSHRFVMQGHRVVREFQIRRRGSK